eukprot:TRINITY_DN24659_c0_g1_i1.p1 TRINITY_DN24659_c0_g1~~TRINITY_DN24659_c0_g1_i1.p1  ORF type:complete len:822 (-),score=125.82 TRINITY_DN24659_c0_g1_i1:59-2524(-)
MLARICVEPRFSVATRWRLLWALLTSLLLQGPQLPVAQDFDAAGVHSRGLLFTSSSEVASLLEGSGATKDDAPACSENEKLSTLSSRSQMQTGGWSFNTSLDTDDFSKGHYVGWAHAENEGDIQATLRGSGVLRLSLREGHAQDDLRSRLTIYKNDMPVQALSSGTEALVDLAFADGDVVKIQEHFGIIELIGVQVLCQAVQALSDACADDFQKLKHMSGRIHSFGEPVFDWDSELRMTVDSKLRFCWRKPDVCRIFVALVEYVHIADLEDTELAHELMSWVRRGANSKLSRVSGAATVLVLAPLVCSVQEVERHLAPQVVQGANDQQHFAVIEVAAKAVEPGAFEQHRSHENLSRWIPRYPDGPLYPSGPVEGFTSECHRAAVGPTEETPDKLFHRFFGRMLCSPTIRSRAEDFGGPASQLKIYVEELPSILHSDRLLVANLVRLAHGFACDAGAFLCTEETWDGAWSTWRQYIGEAVLLQKFLTAPPGVLVDDPKDADIILVPLLTQFVSSWFVFKQVARGCPREILKFLKHLNWPATHGVHVFLFADHMINLREHDPAGLLSLFAMSKETLFISHGSEVGTTAHITMPSVLTDAELQPSALISESSVERDIFLVYSESPDCCHPVRRALYDLLTSDLGRMLCGSSCLVHKRSRASVGSEATATHGLANLSNLEFNAAMRRAIFCPMGPGDSPHRHKLFHAILAGCIPVLFDFASYWQGHRSWWKDFGAPYELTAPFPEDVPYEDIVVRIPCTMNYTDSALSMLWKMRTMSQEEIKHRQDSIRRSRHLLAFNWDGSTPDAFTAIMARITDFVQRRPRIR